MNMKEAVEATKAFAQSLMEGEGISNLGVEEILRNGECWEVTLGFSRPWNSSRGALSAITGENLQKRAYRTFLVADDGSVLSMKRKEVIE